MSYEIDILRRRVELLRCQYRYEVCTTICYSVCTAAAFVLLLIRGWKINHPEDSEVILQIMWLVLGISNCVVTTLQAKRTSVLRVEYRAAQTRYAVAVGDA